MRRAFVMGSNGPEKFGTLAQLRYALNDVNNIRKCLENPRCGFEVQSPQQGVDTFTVLEQLTEVVELCRAEDTFICYFSGHGYLHNGKLFLLWNKSARERMLSSALPAIRVMDVMEECKARNKLLILDCCHAGAAVGAKTGGGIRIGEVSGVKKPTNYQILLASERLDAARELEDFEGSFLTTKICSALDEEFYDADKDGDGRLTVLELQEWLREEVEEYRQQHVENDIPVPFLFGRGDFSLTSSDWEPYEIDWVDGSKMIVLPIKPMYGMAQCISKHPVTNAQYKRFVEEAQKQEPVGDHFVDEYWQGPFYPWKDNNFKDSEQPVVCVSYQDAKHYCNWVNHLKFQQGLRQFLTKLPDPALWDFAACGSEFPTSNPEIRLQQTRRIHDQSTAPVPIDVSGERWNIRGVSDMFGNIWEWCYALNEEEDEVVERIVLSETPEPRPELRGGSFLDNISSIQTFLDSYSVVDRANTRHSDLGLRIAAEVPVTSLPSEIQSKLLMCRSLSRVIWRQREEAENIFRQINQRGAHLTRLEIGRIGRVVGVAVAFNPVSSTFGIPEVVRAVTARIDSLSDPSNRTLKELLKQFQVILTTTSDLDDEDKVEALEQINVIVKAVQDPHNQSLRKSAKTSIKILKGTLADLPSNSELQLQLNKLLPLLEEPLK